MLSDYFSAHATDLNSLQPALNQIASTVLKVLRKCLIKRMYQDNVSFYLKNPRDEFAFYDSRGNRMIASETFKRIYQAGYHRALFDVCQDISAELDARESWKL